jgi:hypothetical protein
MAEIKERIPSYPIRIPKELREWVADRAHFNRRSLNTELNVMLEIAKEAMEKKDGLGKPI